MIRKPRKVHDLLPSVVETDRPISDLVRGALHHRATGDRLQSLLHEELDETLTGCIVSEVVESDESEESDEQHLRRLACYVSDEDEMLVMQLAEVLPQVIEWAVTKGWAWRRG